MPLTYKQLQSMKKMQEIAPLQKKLQEKYKNNKEKLNKEIMELYRKNNVNPAAGCLPLLLQMPFLFAFFRLLQNYDFAKAGFLWIKDLGAPDGTYILPVLAGLTTYLSSKMTTPSDSSQGNMTLFMSIFIAWISTRFAAGLALYWVVSNLIQLIQQLIMTRSVAVAKEESSS
jgi:YidC/Oxa1 family membrane protein insertase